MKKHFVYELPPTDYFFMFKTLNEICKELGEEHEEAKRLQKIVSEAKERFLKFTQWESDGGENPYILGLPSKNDVFPEILVLIKQSNNGSTFLFSPLELPHLKEFLVKSL